MKIVEKTVIFLLLLLPLFTACSESEELSPYHNWEKRNAQYVDSIAGVARDNVGGDWKIVLPVGLDPAVQHPNDNYVYCKVKSAGSGTVSPSYNDTVFVNYRGQLIDGRVFDSTYSGELVPEYETPVETPLSECVQGFVAAVQEMVAGDIWEVYIPSALGYGADDYGVVRENSTLIFTINLVKFFHVGEK